MTDTTISTGICAPQDDGTGVTDGEEDFTSAAYFQLLSKYKGDGSYVGEDTNGSPTLGFSNVDTGNNEFDLNQGYAYIMGGNHSVQAGAQSVYNVALPNQSPYVVVLPNGAANLSLDSGTNDVWLAVEEDSNDSVYIRHGTGLSAPSDPSVKLGTVDSSSGATTRDSDLAATSLRSVDTDKLAITESGVEDFGTISGGGQETTIVSFSQSYSSAPLIVVTPGGTDSSPQPHTTHWTQEIDTSNFRLGIRNEGDSNGTYDHCSWVAFEQP